MVGNGQYRDVDQFVNPENDARLIATTLQAAGFTLIGGGPQLNVQKSLFDGLIQQFGNALPGADTALFYYSGHGCRYKERIGLCQLMLIRLMPETSIFRWWMPV